GGALEDIGASAAASLGFTSATVGTLAAIVGGIIAATWGIGRRKVAEVPAQCVPEELRTGYLANIAERLSVGRVTTSPSAIEPLTLHLGFIVLTVVCAYGLNNLISSIWEQVSVPLFAMSIVLGLIFRAIMNAIGAKDYLDRETTSSVSGAA